MVGDLLFDDQLVFGIDRHLRIVTDGDTGMRCHRTAVGVSERDLTLAGAVKFRQHFLAARLALADRGDLLGQVLDPRSRCRRFGGVAGVKPEKFLEGSV